MTLHDEVRLPRWAITVVGSLVGIVFAAGMTMSVLNSTGRTAADTATRVQALSDQQIKIADKQDALVATVAQYGHRIDSDEAKNNLQDASLATIQATLTQINERLAELLKRSNPRGG